MSNGAPQGVHARALADAAWSAVTRPSASTTTMEDVGWNAYDASRWRAPWFDSWHSPLRSPDLEWLPERSTAQGRSRDQIRNDPLAATAVQRKKNTAVGKGWLLSSRPIAKALGITEEQASELGDQIEAEWKQYAFGHSFQIDGLRKLDFSGLLRLAVGHVQADGEALGVVEWAADEATRYKTRLRIVDPDRLSNPYDRINDRVFRGGVEHDGRGVPVAYWIREQHPHDFMAVGSYVWQRWDRFTPWGRPQVLHCFEPERDGQSRGVSRFVSALKGFRALSRFTDATLQAATINALIVGQVQSSAGPEAVSESFTLDDMIKFDAAREAFYEKNPVSLNGGARVPVFPFGDEFKLATASKEVAPFEGFMRTIVRPIAARLGVSYEELTGDLSGVNYSSLKAGWLMALRDTEVLISLLLAQLVRPFFVGWLEEAFGRGYIVAPEGAPDFLDAPDAYANAEWIGPGQGQLDKVKENLGDAAAEEAGFETFQDLCAARGKDWRENLRAEAEVMREREKLGLQSATAADAQAIQDTKNPAKQAPDPSTDTGQPVPEPQPAKGVRAPRASRGWLSRLARLAGPAHDRELDERAAA